MNHLLRGKDRSFENSFGKWDREADVLIAGYGGAGAVAAISAHDAGADILLVESMSRGGGNTAVSMGGFLCPTNMRDAMRYINGLYEFSHSELDQDMVRVFARESLKNVAWIKSLRPGTEVQVYGQASFPQVPGAEAVNKYLVKGKHKGMTAFAQNLWELLTYAVEEVRKIAVLTSTPVRRLLTSVTGEVIGLVAGQDSKEMSIRARRGVILTTGGYECDVKTLQNHVKGFPIYSAGSPGNTGDGLVFGRIAGHNAAAEEPWTGHDH